MGPMTSLAAFRTQVLTWLHHRHASLHGLYPFTSQVRQTEMVILTMGTLWTTGISVGCLSQPSADFTELRTVKLSLSTARRSLWWMFPSIGLSVLLQFHHCSA